jgi:flagellar hook-basal body complex protein FliE
MKDVAKGNLDRLPDALVMATQFDLAINLVVQIRNRLMEGFQEFMRITM